MKQHFQPHEFDCKCGCGLNNMNLSFLDDLNTAREIAQIPFVITSGSRCPVHNKRERGLSNSAHLKGLAVDIKTDSSIARFKTIQALQYVGFNRIGISKHFIHVDNDVTKPSPVMWMY